MRRRPGESPQKSGTRFERYWSSLFGVQPVKGSGNTWTCKLDVKDGSITWSCKWTSHESFRISKELMQEAIDGVHQNGDDSIPGIAMAIDGGSEVIVAMRADDLLRLLSSDAAGYITPSKANQKRALARIPSLMRDEGENEPPSGG